LKNNREGLIKDIFRFLEVDDSFTPGNIKQVYNETRKPHNMLLHNFFVKPNPVHDFLIKVVPVKVRKKLRLYERNLGPKTPPMPDHIRLNLLAHYREEIGQLQDLIGRDLSHWLAPLNKNGQS